MLIKHFSQFCLVYGLISHPTLENLVLLETSIGWPFNSSTTFIQTMFSEQLQYASP